MDAILIGYSGHGKVLLEAAGLTGINVIGYCDIHEKHQSLIKLPYLGNEQDDNFDWNKCGNYILGIGDNLKRRDLFNKIKAQGKKCLSLIHPDAKTSSYIKVGEGTFIARGASINPDVQIGNGVIINTNASVDHDCQIGSFSHLAPGAVLSGGIKTGESVFIGANSVIKEYLVINSYSIIGAGSTVVHNIESHSKVFGNPAKRRN